MSCWKNRLASFSSSAPLSLHAFQYVIPLELLLASHPRMQRSESQWQRRAENLPDILIQVTSRRIFESNAQVRGREENLPEEHHVRVAEAAVREDLTRNMLGHVLMATGQEFDGHLLARVPGAADTRVLRLSKRPWAGKQPCRELEADLFLASCTTPNAPSPSSDILSYLWWPARGSTLLRIAPEICKARQDKCVLNRAA